MYVTDACANIEMMTASYARLACAQCIKQKKIAKKVRKEKKKNRQFFAQSFPPTVYYFLLQA